MRNSLTHPHHCPNAYPNRDGGREIQFRQAEGKMECGGIEEKGAQIARQKKKR